MPLPQTGTARKQAPFPLASGRILGSIGGPPLPQITYAVWLQAAWENCRLPWDRPKSVPVLESERLSRRLYHRCEVKKQSVTRLSSCLSIPWAGWGEDLGQMLRKEMMTQPREKLQALLYQNADSRNRNAASNIVQLLRKTSTDENMRVRLKYLLSQEVKKYFTHNSASSQCRRPLPFSRFAFFLHVKNHLCTVCIHSKHLLTSSLYSKYGPMFCQEGHSDLDPWAHHVHINAPILFRWL